MLTKLQKWGNGQGVRFTKAILDKAQIRVGDQVNVSVRKGRIIVEPVRTVRGKYDLKDLISKIPENYRTEEPDWGPAVGKETW